MSFAVHSRKVPGTILLIPIMINLAVHVQCRELFEDFLTIGAVNVLGKAEMLGAVDVHHQTPRIKEISFIDPISFNLNSHW